MSPVGVRPLPLLSETRESLSRDLAGGEVYCSAYRRMGATEVHEEDAVDVDVNVVEPLPTAPVEFVVNDADRCIPK